MSVQDLAYGQCKSPIPSALFLLTKCRRDFADAYPSAQVIGSDLSPCQPEWVPPNVHFEVADASLQWPWKDDYFDFVHVRYLFGAIHDWPALFCEAYRCCAPGGWVQSCEADYVHRRIAREAHSVKVWRQVPVGGWPNNRRLAETG
ncbi:hypothetical protein NW766_005356, partial [Fusarium irregulare]